jgi:hypothetical protein
MVFGLPIHDHILILGFIALLITLWIAMNEITATLSSNLSDISRELRDISKTLQK